MPALFYGSSNRIQYRPVRATRSVKPLSMLLCLLRHFEVDLFQSRLKWVHSPSTPSSFTTTFTPLCRQAMSLCLQAMPLYLQAMPLCLQAMTLWWTICVAGFLWLPQELRTHQPTGCGHHTKAERLHCSIHSSKTDPFRAVVIIPTVQFRHGHGTHQ